MTEPLRLVTGSTPKFTFDLLDENTKIALDLSNVLTTVVFNIRKLDSVPATAINCTKLAGLQQGNQLVTTTPYDTPGRGGRVEAQAPPGLFPTPGPYEGEIVITYGAESLVLPVYQTVRIVARKAFA